MLKTESKDKMATRDGFGRELVELGAEKDFVVMCADLAESTRTIWFKEKYPDIGFFSEEEDGKLSDPCWILDPIDGTTNLVYGYNVSSVSLGLYSGGQVVFGVVYNPFTNECYTAQLGKGAYLDGKKIHVSNRHMSDSIIEFGAGSTRKNEADEAFAIAKDIFMQCIDLRRICSSALNLCYIAEGRIDGYFEKKLKPWDYAAGSLILKESGGKITDYTGHDVPMDVPSTVIASNGYIHENILGVVNKWVKL